jgi:membrane-bound transcription factor site-1 protease
MALRCCVQISYGANIAKFPAGGILHVSHINDASGKSSPTPGDWAAFGVTARGKGQVAVLGDTNCLDSSHMVRGGGH